VASTPLFPLGLALVGLADAGVRPSAALVTALYERAAQPTPRGNPAIVEADPKAVSTLLLAAARHLARASRAARGGDGGSAEGEELEARLWPLLEKAAEVKVRRALGWSARAVGR
jgi:hypothetical protein